ncbi:MAG: ABC transporter permease, partial [Thermoanaerobaculia bacterium]
MTRAMAIAAREIREHKFAFLMAALSALLQFVVVLLPGTKQTDPRTLIVITSMVVAIGVTLGLAVILGGSIVSRELAERRLSFYLSKPVSAAAIWFGKLTGALVIIGVGLAIIVVPSFVIAHSAWTPAWNVPVELFVAAVFGAAVALLLISHALSTMVRSRSPLIALDFALLAVTILAVWLLVRPLLESFALGVAQTVMVAIVAAVVVAIAAAGAWQISRGRTDIKRRHREFSRFFWTSMAVVIAIAGAYVGWVFSAGPADLVNRVVLGNTRGDWMIVTGADFRRGDYRPTFLVNLENGKSMRFPSTRWMTGEFTRRGDAVVAVAPLSDWGRMMNRGELHVQTLDAPRARTGTGIETMYWSRKVVSDDLRRVAILSSDLLSVYDLQSNALLGSVRIPYSSGVTLYFVSPDVVRVYASSQPAMAAVVRRELRILEFSVAKRQLQQTGQFTTTAQTLFSRASADGSLLVLTRLDIADQPRVMVLD